MQNKRIVCIAMGKLRKAQSPVVGDMVVIEQFQDQCGIQKILPRKNELTRPLISNVDQAIIVMSAKDPNFSTVLMDRLIFLIVYAQIRPILCITKLDLIDQSDAVYKAIQAYENSGYEVYRSGRGYASVELMQAMKNKISVLSGQSGAGKSSLLNRIDPCFHLQTQEISKALGRGKHTTRHCELHYIAGGWVADTPGFSSMDFTYMDIHALASCIPDFAPYQGTCRFKNCIHEFEPDCNIRALVKRGVVSQDRYDHYLEIVSIIKARKMKY